MIAVSKEELYRLVDALPESEHNTAARVLNALSIAGEGKGLHTLESAPFDDEEEQESDEEERALQHARQEAVAGEVVQASAVFRRFGL